MLRLWPQSEKRISDNKTYDIYRFGDLTFKLIRKPRLRAINLKVRRNGTLEISVWKTVRLKQVEHFVKENISWIKRELEIIEKDTDSFPPKILADGTEVPFLGKFYPITFVRRARGGRVVFNEDHIEIPTSESWPSQQQIKKSLAHFYTRAAKKIINARVAALAKKMELFPANLTFRKQRTRWGSCSSTGAISLNVKLMAAPVEVIDYVIVHELSHLEHMNHSPEFWNLVGEFSPRYELCRKWLSDNQSAFDFLDEIPETHASRVV